VVLVPRPGSLLIILFFKRIWFLVPWSPPPVLDHFCPPRLQTPCSFLVFPFNRLLPYWRPPPFPFFPPTMVDATFYNCLFVRRFFPPPTAPFLFCCSSFFVFLVFSALRLATSSCPFLLPSPHAHFPCSRRFWALLPHRFFPLLSPHGFFFSSLPNPGE